MRTEKELRGDRGLVGVWARLQDGASWCVPSRPLVGPTADAMTDLLREIDRGRRKAVAINYAESQRVDAARKEIKKSGAGVVEAELEKIAAESTEIERASIAASLAVIGHALRMNYPSLEDQELHALVTIGHLAPLLSIIRGERQLEDLFGRERTENPPPA